MQELQTFKVLEANTETSAIRVGYGCLWASWPWGDKSRLISLKEQFDSFKLHACVNFNLKRRKLLRIMSSFPSTRK